MTNAVATATPAAVASPKKIAAKKSTAVKKPAVTKSSHPPVAQMVNAALAVLKEKKGSSLQAIKKYIAATYNVDVDKQATYIRKYLRAAVIAKTIVQTKGSGASGSFKLADVAKKPAGEKKAIAAKKPAATKKPVAKTLVKKVTSPMKAKTTKPVKEKSLSKAKKSGKAPAANTKSPKPKKTVAPKAKKPVKK